MSKLNFLTLIRTLRKAISRVPGDNLQLVVAYNKKGSVRLPSPSVPNGVIMRRHAWHALMLRLTSDNSELLLLQLLLLFKNVS